MTAHFHAVRIAARSLPASIPCYSALSRPRRRLVRRTPQGGLPRHPGGVSSFQRGRGAGIMPAPRAMPLPVAPAAGRPIGGTGPRRRRMRRHRSVAPRGAGCSILAFGRSGPTPSAGPRVADCFSRGTAVVSPRHFAVVASFALRHPQCCLFM